MLVYFEYITCITKKYQKIESSFMIIFLLFLTFSCHGMQRVELDGSQIFFRDITLQEYALYWFTPPKKSILMLPQNWLALDKESQVPYYYNELLLRIGNKPTTKHSDKEDVKICNFIYGHPDAQDFEINSFLLNGRGQNITIFDGVQTIGLGRHAKYYWISGLQDGSEFRSNVHQSTRSEDYVLPQLDHQVQMNITACALKFPFMAYAAQYSDKSSNHLTIKGLFFSNGCSFLKESLKKLSWLQEKNLLGLTESGDIVTIGVYDQGFDIFPQHFKDKKFIDIAVDMKHPVRFIALTDDFKIIYADFSSHQATVKKPHNVLFNPLASAVNYVTHKKFFEKETITKKFSSKKIYRTIKQLPPSAKDKIYKIWFHNNKIGVYCGEKENTNGTLEIFKLEDRIFTLNINDVYNTKNEKTCLQDAVRQLDCHI